MEKAAKDPKRLLRGLNKYSIYFDFCIFSINTLTAQSERYHLIAFSSLKFAQLLLIQNLNHLSESHGDNFFKMETTP